MEKNKISVIVPVHNGERYILNTVNNILNQDYQNIELILVENFSSDNSLNICNRLKEKDSRVIVLVSKEKGTSMARKKGVEAASGRYIVFSDQDDHYVDNHALTNMYQAITEDHAQICQFGYYTQYAWGIKKKKNCTNERLVLSRKELLSKEISGIWGNKDSHYTSTVWTKIYEAEVLKSAVENINIPLFFCEDLYLNTLAFFNEKVSTVSVRPEAYYAWKIGTGFSSSAKAGEVLIREYKIPKKTVFELCEKYNVSKGLLEGTHEESLYILKVCVDAMIREQRNKSSVIDFINEVTGFDYISEAKDYVNREVVDVWDELAFLASDYSAEGYYEHCRAHLAQEGLGKKVKRFLISTAKKVIYCH